MVIRDPWLRALVIVMLLIAIVYLAALLWQAVLQFADIILLFFLAWLISFILDPVVGALYARLRGPRAIAVALTYALVFLIACVVIVNLAPPLSQQAIQFSNELPLYANWLFNELIRLEAFFTVWGISFAVDSLVARQEVLRHIESVGPWLLSNAVGLATGVANLLLQMVVILMLSYYISLDGRRISGALHRALPKALRGDARHFLESVNRAFGGFLRGQLLLGIIYGAGTFIVMQIANLELALLSSLLAAVFMLIPFIGPFLAMGLPLVVSAVTQPDTLVFVFVALFVLQQVLVNLISPRLMSSTVGLHPLLVFLAILVGAKVAGIWGAVFGVPIAGVVSAMVSFYWTGVEERRAALEAEPADAQVDPPAAPAAFGAMSDPPTGAPRQSNRSDLPEDARPVREAVGQRATTPSPVQGDAPQA